MPRPSNQTDLIDLAQSNFKKIFDLIDALNAQEQAQEFAFEDRDRNVRDVLIHLYEWHQLLLNWVCNNKTEPVVHFLPSPYTWKTYPEMNVRLWEKHQKTPFLVSVSMLRNSHADVVAMISSFSNEALFTKKFYPWTGTTSLASYCISATSSHYDWALKKLRRHKRSL